METETHRRRVASFCSNAQISKALIPDFKSLIMRKPCMAEQDLTFNHYKCKVINKENSISMVLGYYIEILWWLEHEKPKREKGYGRRSYVNLVLWWSQLSDKKRDIYKIIIALGKI